MRCDELLSVTLCSIDDNARGAVLEKITDLKSQSLQATPREGVTTDNLTAATPIPFSLNQLWFDFHRDMNATHNVAGGQSRQTEALLQDAHGSPVQLRHPSQGIRRKYAHQTH